MRTMVRSAGDQFSGAPRGVADQSSERTSSPISPAACRTSSAGFVARAPGITYRSALASGPCPYDTPDLRVVHASPAHYPPCGQTGKFMGGSSLLKKVPAENHQPIVGAGKSCIDFA